MALFDQVTASFWHADNKHGMLQPLDGDLVIVAEQAFGVTLPVDLVRLLRIQNGGVVADAWDACPAESNYYAQDHVPFETLVGIGPADRPHALTMLDNNYLIQEWEMPKQLVLLAGDGHCWVTLDYRASGPNGDPAIS